MTPTVTLADYVQAFEVERTRQYPMIDAFERRMGFMLDRQLLESAARVLACPVKAHAPNWQHGRVIYAAARRALAMPLSGEPRRLPVRLLDIGTAKGFSALCLQWALRDAGIPGQVVSVDVVDPNERRSRNSIADVDTPHTLPEYLAPWREALSIHFEQSSGIDWLRAHAERIQVAFIDGKHTYETVREEAALLSTRQAPGDIVIFDDAQIPGVRRAILERSDYALEHLAARPERIYAIGIWRRR